MIHTQALEIAERLVAELRPGCERIEIAGSVRRKKRDVHDIEIVALPKLVRVSDLFGNPTAEYSLLDAELTRLNLHQIKGGDRYKQYALPDGINLDLFIVRQPAQWGVIFTLRTGPADFSKWLVTQRRYGGALPSHYQIREGGVYNGPNLVKTPEEKDFFALLGLDWIEPEHRKR